MIHKLICNLQDTLPPFAICVFLQTAFVKGLGVWVFCQSLRTSFSTKICSEIYEYLWRTIIQASGSEGLKPNNEFHFALTSCDECIHAVDITVSRHRRRISLIHIFCLERILALLLEHDVPIINAAYKALIGQLFFQPRRQSSVRTTPDLLELQKKNLRYEQKKVWFQYWNATVAMIPEELSPAFRCVCVLMLLSQKTATL